ncbi:hypothetical protein EV2_028386 [Malus domestica]
MFLKFSLWKGVIRFEIEDKLSSRYIRPYVIIERVCEVAYRLELPPELSEVLDVFYVSMLRYYVADSSHVILVQPLEINPNLTYGEEPMTILEWKEKKSSEMKQCTWYKFCGEIIQWNKLCES